MTPSPPAPRPGAAGPWGGRTGREMPWSQLEAHAPSFTIPPHSGLRSAFPDSLLTDETTFSLSQIWKLNPTPGGMSPSSMVSLIVESEPSMFASSQISSPRYDACVDDPLKSVAFILKSKKSGSIRCQHVTIMPCEPGESVVIVRESVCIDYNGKNVSSHVAGFRDDTTGEILYLERHGFEESDSVRWVREIPDEVDHSRKSRRLKWHSRVKTVESEPARDPFQVRVGDVA